LYNSTSRRCCASRGCLSRTWPSRAPARRARWTLKVPDTPKPVLDTPTDVLYPPADVLGTPNYVLNTLTDVLYTPVPGLDTLESGLSRTWPSRVLGRRARWTLKVLAPYWTHLLTCWTHLTTFCTHQRTDVLDTHALGLDTLDVVLYTPVPVLDTLESGRNVQEPGHHGRREKGQDGR